MGLAGTWRYDAIEVTQAQLPDVLAGLDSSWRGLSLTMPLKEVALGFLDGVSPRAQLLASVNTVLVEWVDGVARLRGENTDTWGMLAAVREAISELRTDPPGNPSLGNQSASGALRGCVLGAGATARSALAALVELGCQDVTVVARRPEAVRGLATMSDELGLGVQAASWSHAWPAMAAAHITISTVPAGATHELAQQVRRDGPLLRHVPGRPDAPGRPDVPGQPHAPVLLDVVYEPWPTPLVEVWESLGGIVVSGASMLLHQAAAQVELMTGRRPAPIHAMRAALS